MYYSISTAGIAARLKHRVLVAEILNLDAEHELHAAEVLRQGFGLVTFDDEPEGLTVFDGCGGVLDASLRGQQQEFTTIAGLHIAQNLRGDGGQPGQAVRARHSHDTQGRAVYHHQGFVRPGGTVAAQGSLLVDGVAVVGRHALVGAAGGESPAHRKQGTCGARGPVLFGPGRIGQRFSHGGNLSHKRTHPTGERGRLSLLARTIRRRAYRRARQ